jgi:hypothetical protein
VYINQVETVMAMMLVLMEAELKSIILPVVSFLFMLSSFRTGYNIVWLWDEIGCLQYTRALQNFRFGLAGCTANGLNGVSQLSFSMHR